MITILFRYDKYISSISNKQAENADCYFFITFVLQSPMSGLTNLCIMTSKILIGLTENSQPCIKVNLGSNSDDDLRDQVINLFFEGLQHESSFVGVVTKESNSYRELIPLSIIHTCEWLERFFVNNKVHTEDHAEKMLLAFKSLRELYYNSNSIDTPDTIKERVALIMSKKG